MCPPSALHTASKGPPASETLFHAGLTPSPPFPPSPSLPGPGLAVQILENHGTQELGQHWGPPVVTVGAPLPSRTLVSAGSCAGTCDPITLGVAARLSQPDSTSLTAPPELAPAPLLPGHPLTLWAICWEQLDSGSQNGSSGVPGGASPTGIRDFPPGRAARRPSSMVLAALQMTLGSLHASVRLSLGATAARHKQPRYLQARLCEGPGGPVREQRSQHPCHSLPLRGLRFRLGCTGEPPHCWA